MEFCDKYQFCEPGQFCDLTRHLDINACPFVVEINNAEIRIKIEIGPWTIAK